MDRHGPDCLYLGPVHPRDQSHLEEHQGVQNRHSAQWQTQLGSSEPALSSVGQPSWARLTRQVLHYTQHVHSRSTQHTSLSNPAQHIIAQCVDLRRQGSLYTSGSSVWTCAGRVLYTLAVLTGAFRCVRLFWKWRFLCDHCRKTQRNIQHDLTQNIQTQRNIQHDLFPFSFLGRFSNSYVK